MVNKKFFIMLFVIALFLLTVNVVAVLARNEVVCGVRNRDSAGGGNELDMWYCCDLQSSISGVRIDYSDIRVVNPLGDSGSGWCPTGYVGCGFRNHPTRGNVLDYLYCCKVIHPTFSSVGRNYPTSFNPSGSGTTYYCPYSASYGYKAVFGVFNNGDNSGDELEGGWCYNFYAGGSILAGVKATWPRLEDITSDGGSGYCDECTGNADCDHFDAACTYGQCTANSWGNRCELKYKTSAACTCAGTNDFNCNNCDVWTSECATCCNRDYELENCWCEPGWGCGGGWSRRGG